MYRRDYQIVDVTYTEDRKYVLTPYADNVRLSESLGEFLSTPEELGKSAGTFEIEQEIFDTAVKLFDSGDLSSGKNQLKSAGLKDENIENLTDALGKNGQTMIAIHISNASQPEKAHMQGTGYISGRSGGWLIKQYEQDGKAYMHFQPGLVQEFRELTFSMTE